MRKYTRYDIYAETPLKVYRKLKLMDNPTPTEELLWAKLKSRQLAVTFVRQKIIVGYIADFYCQKYKLVIELDGNGHDPGKDKIRDNHLNTAGVYVMRFRNDEVWKSIDSVVLRIKVKLLESEKLSAKRKAEFKARLSKPRRIRPMTSVLPDRANRYWNTGNTKGIF